MTSIPEARTAFNLKVLRRHDPSIVSIIETASFVVLYNYNSGEWTKTGVEGPLFLFRRRLPPYNGFFLMNRNGVENFSADIAPEDDLEITPEFVIYRPEGKEEEVYGIWIFEQGQRMVVGDKLLKLQQMGDAPSKEEVERAERASQQASAAAAAAVVRAESKLTATATGADNNGGGEKKSSKSNKANGKGKKAPKGKKGHNNSNNNDDTDAEKEVTSSSVDSELSTQSQQINLDDLFGSSSAPALPAQKEEETTGVTQEKKQAPAATAMAANGGATSLLDSLFQSAVSLDSNAGSSPASAEVRESAAPPTSTSTDKNHSQNLLALLGSGGGNSAFPAPTAQPEASHTNGNPAEEPQPPSSTTTITEKKGEAPKMSTLLEANIHDRIGLGDDGQPLSRREFVTELLTMVHTNPEFVSELYSSYIARVSPAS